MVKRTMMKVKTMFIGIGIGVTCAALILGFAGVSAISISDEVAVDAIKALAEYVRQNPQSEEVAKKLADIVLSLNPNVQLGAAGNANQEESSNFNEIGLITQDEDEVWTCGVIKGNLPTATTTVSEDIRRLTDDAIYVRGAMIEIAGFVSSTFSVAIGTTTPVSTVTGTAFVAPYATIANIPDGILAQSLFVTSTVRRVQFNAGYVPFVSATSSIEGRNMAGTGALASTILTRVASSTPIVIFMQSRIDITSTTPTGVCDSAGIQCEAVTSSNRGFTGQYIIDYCRDEVSNQ